jgi:hypothetical protein
MRGSVRGPAIRLGLDDGARDARAIRGGHDEALAEEISGHREDTGPRVKLARQHRVPPGAHHRRAGPHAARGVEMPRGAGRAPADRVGLVVPEIL